MHDPATSPAAEPLKVVLGGETLIVQFLSGQDPETIKVRFLPVAHYADFALVLGDEGGQVALFCDRPREWAESLHPQSHSDVMEIGHRLNLDFFERWMSRQTRARQVVDPGLNERMERLAAGILREELTKRLPASLLPASAPALPDSPAAP